MNRDGSNQRQLTSNSTNDRLPAWSPDSQQIIYHASNDDIEDSEIFIINLFENEPQRITFTDQIEGHASWSINNQLTYNAKETDDDFWQIFTSEEDGQNQIPITEGAVDNWSPEWSPDGDKIVFLSGPDTIESDGIFIMDSDGSNVQLVYNGDGLEWGASWSSSGEQIIFTVDQPDGTADIYRMSVNNPNSAALITERGGYPSWAVPLQPNTSTTSLAPVATSLPACLTNALGRWQSNIYPEFASRLGCVHTVETPLEGVYQLYEDGLMVWRKDTNSIYVLYYAESYQFYSINSTVGTNFEESELTKGAIGHLWSTNLSVQNQLGNPLESEMGMSEFVLQEFQNGTIFYFKENRENTYVLMSDQNELRMIQEK